MRVIAFPRRERDDLSRVVENQTRLHDALKSLFDLLEHYGPTWYTKQYHDEAQSALRMPVPRVHTSNRRNSNKGLRRAS
jgi:hypothetical protein